MKGADKPPPSIIPDKPDETGLIHFYKLDNEWKFLTSAEYEEHKAELPPLSFATRHPIGSFMDKSFPDLEELTAKV